ncbi:MAG TPA: hypothetical protein VJO33_01975 [Gemmatimonadaceae bacterium]|nr:hypothetical protein [Gemmatimonadaceae bacterium]
MRLLITLALAMLNVSAIATSEAQVAASHDTAVPPMVARAISDGTRAELLLIFGPRADSGGKRRDAFFSNEMRLVEVRTFDSQALGVPGAQVWIAFPEGVDHWYHYTVAVRRSEVFRLGGFEAPELLAFDRALGSAKETESKRAALLATVADPNGGVQLRLTDQQRIPLSTGEILVRITSESLQEHAFAEYRSRFRYAFLFSESGALVDWARTEIAKHD